MSGATLTVEVPVAGTLENLARLKSALTEPRDLLAQLGEYLLGSTKDRFKAQTDPQGQHWRALSPRYLAAKKRNRDKILTASGLLRDQMAFQIEADAVLVGSNLKYAGIHQFGGTFEIPPRSQHVFRKANSRSGRVRRLFAKKDAEGSVAQRVTLPAVKISIPARPYLGMSAADRSEVVERTRLFLLGQLTL